MLSPRSAHQTWGSPSAVHHSSFIDHRSPTPIGYCIAQDRYFKRDDVGIIYQMNVVPGRQRAFVGAALLAEQFEWSAYGCRLYCCWCAQDIAANKFWEAMGFVPLAFRAGGVKRGRRKAERGTEGAGGTGAGSSTSHEPRITNHVFARVHIFWQKRIREGDATTPWWFPSKTGGGAIREDRIVLPIPPGTRWSDAKPMVLPGEERDSGLVVRDSGEGRKTQALPSPTTNHQHPATASPRTTKHESRTTTPSLVRRNGLMFDIPQQRTPSPAVAVGKKAKKPKARRVFDPRVLAAARELCDRWLEQVNGPDAHEHEPRAVGKYDVRRLIEATGASPRAIAA